MINRVKVLAVTTVLLLFGQLLWASDGHTLGLSITRLYIVFENGKNVATLSSGESLRAHAVVNYRGAGLFEGRWRVNGRLISTVRKTLGGSRSVTFSTPRVPPLPTTQMGTYKLEFEVSNPHEVGSAPVLLYHIMGGSS
ncbi:MAG: hypothetical protein ABFS19_07740 [Thermodesulfobacteriota bacterium]